MKRRTAWILFGAVAAVALGAAVVGGLALALRGQGGGGGGITSSRSYLLLELGGEIPEHPPTELGSFLEKRPPSLRTLVDSLDRAAGDSHVEAVVVKIGFLDTGWAKVQELRDAIARFQASGKPAYAHLEFCGNKEYYLATACKKVYAVPSALLDVSGLATEVTFLRGTLDKLGVEAQFEGVGKYKNAPNQFTEKGFTEPHREQMEALTDSLFQEYATAIGKSRGKTPEEVQRALDEGPYDARRALKAGLVDELLYDDQVRERLKNADKIVPSRYVRRSKGFGFDSRPKFALIYAVGEIVSGESQQGPFGGSVAGSQTVASALRSAREDDDIKAIVFRVDSPGGSGTASDVIWREVQLARKKKPVVVSMGDLAASGGYYVSMGSDAIVAQPGTITGSIGVFGGKFILKGFYDKIGLSKELLSRGRHAALFTEYKPWTEEERALVRELMVSFYQDFIQKAAEGRHKKPEEVDAIGQGRVWTGVEAKRLGLVDQLGGMDTAIDVAREKAKLKKDQPVQLVVIPQRKGLLETLLERQEEGIESTLPRDVRATLAWLVRVRSNEPVARLPFELSVR